LRALSFMLVAGDKRTRFVERSCSDDVDYGCCAQGLIALYVGCLPLRRGAAIALLEVMVLGGTPWCRPEQPEQVLGQL
jgi:hypothetical protein